MNHIEFVPVYPMMKEIPNLEIAVTPGEVRYVPKNVKQTIDMAWYLQGVYSEII